MDKTTRNSIQRATEAARRLLEQELREQLEGEYDILLNGSVGMAPGAHLSPAQRIAWEKLVSAIAHKRSTGASSAGAVAALLREMAFQTLNRFVALKMFEARELAQECVSKGEDSSGFKEFCALAPGLVLLPDAGYRLYIESIFDEMSQEVGALFDRGDVASLLWPRRPALQALLQIVNAPELESVWEQDETIGWVYQYFNGDDERTRMRAESQAPRSSRELAVRNQFFTPRYVVQFLTDNTLGRTWVEMMQSESSLVHLDFIVQPEEGFEERPLKDPRALRILDPACGSGHFLLYAFDLLLTIYQEAWQTGTRAWSESGHTLREDFLTEEKLHRAIPGLILEHNLHGVDIDPRAAQIASLALWMRAQRAFQESGISRVERPSIRRTRVVVAEPMPGDTTLVEEFAGGLQPPVLGELLRVMISKMELAGELGSLLKIEEHLSESVTAARKQYAALEQELSKGYLPGFEPVQAQGELDFSGIDDERFFEHAEAKIVDALQSFAASATGSKGVRRRLFAEDAAQGVAFIELMRKHFDVVLMNPPFGAGSLAAKKELASSYPRTKNDVYAAFVERGIELLEPGGMLGAITSRTGFFLSSFQQWREEILLKEAPPVVFADLGAGVLDSAMVETAAYCLRKEAST